VSELNADLDLEEGVLTLYFHPADAPDASADAVFLAIAKALARDFPDLAEQIREQVRDG
jgi:hypothetical protein